MPERRKSPWAYRLRGISFLDNRDKFYVKPTFETYHLMCDELSDRMRQTSIVTAVELGIVPLPDAHYLAHIVRLDHKPIEFPDNQSTILLPDRDVWLILANINNNGEVRAVAKKLKEIKPTSGVLTAVLFENPWLESAQKADIAIYKTEHEIILPSEVTSWNQEEANT